MYFFSVTKSLFDRIIDFLKITTDVAAPIIVSVAVVFLAIITIGFIKTKNKKKYIGNNFALIVSVLSTEAAVSVLFFNTLSIKFNLLAIVTCLFVIVLNTKYKKRTIKVVKEEKK